MRVCAFLKDQIRRRLGLERSEIFETMPVGRAVAKLAVPTILSQLVTAVYNLADTFFVGQLNNPYMIAAVSLCFPAFLFLTALSNIFGIGGASLISRLLGSKQGERAKRASAFSFYASIALSLLYSLLAILCMDPFLRLLGASDDTIGYASQYLLWVVVVGGVPTTLSLVMANLLRSEGRARQASIGIVLGGLLNMALDPVFIFLFHLDVRGAAIATMLSNLVVLGYFVTVFLRIRYATVLSIRPRDLSLEWKEIVSPILGVGFPAALATMLACVCNAVIVKLASAYGDIPVAAAGIVKKVDSIILNIGVGLTQGILPLVAYNYAAKNYKRMHQVSRFAQLLAAIMSAFFILLFQWQADGIVRLFIKDEATVQMGAAFLRIACLSTPFMIINFHINTTFQGMGKGKVSMLFSACRQGLINIPLLFLMNALFHLYGIMWTQLIADSITLCIGFLLYRNLLKDLDWPCAGGHEPCGRA